RLEPDCLLPVCKIWGMNSTKHTPTTAALMEHASRKKATGPVLALEDMLDDIERLIYHGVSPYVVQSNPMLHLDELCAECRYKLAKIISAGRMQQCPNRTKFFGYLKVSFLNHLRTLVEKYAFSQKRSGFKPQCWSLENSNDDDQSRRK